MSDKPLHLQGPMAGKNVLVTGATAGIGLETAVELASQGAHVFITGRNELQGKKAAADAMQRAGNGTVEFAVADHSTVAGNIEFAEHITKRIERLDVLINNVGRVVAERAENAEGLESNMALNFVGPLVLTNNLLPLLEKGENSRIVNIVSSAFQLWKRTPLEDINNEENFVGVEAHGHAKLLNVLSTMALARKLEGKGISINAVNPGMAWTPGVAALTPQAVPQWRYIWPVVRQFQKRASPEKAAQAPVFLASSPDANFSGRYFNESTETVLPKRLLDTTLQESALRLGQTLAAKAQPNISTQNASEASMKKTWAEERLNQQPALTQGRYH